MPRKGPPDPFPGKPPVDPFNPAPPGQAPIAADDQFSTKQALSLSGNLLANNGAGEDTDPNDDPLTVTEVDGEVISETPISVTSDYGRTAQLLVQDTGALTLNPSTDFNELAVGEDDTITLSYKVSDGRFWDTADVTVTIQGLNDPIQIGTADLSGEVTEDEATPYLTDSGTIEFSDVDWSDEHEASATFKETTHSSQLGTLTAELTTDTTGSGTGGVVEWNFSVDNNNPDVQALKAGESINETHTVTLTDNEGSTISRDVMVSIAGIDDYADIDAFVANIVTPGSRPRGTPAENQVLINDGSGEFTEADTQPVGAAESMEVALGDLDGDHDLDVFVVNRSGPTSQVLINDGTGSFAENPEPPGGFSSYGTALGDLDGDDDLDAFVVTRDGQPNQVLINDGTGVFSAPSELQLPGTFYSTDVALGDLDGDNDLDAFVVNGQGGYPSQVYLNDGTGNFSESELPPPGASSSFGVALGDIDGDGDLDAFVANGAGAQADQVLINDGSGVFSAPSEWQPPDAYNSWYVTLGDLDGDGNIDAIAGDRVLSNDGTGWEHSSWLPQGGWDLTLGDVDADGDLDAFVANSYGPNSLLINDGTGFFSDPAELQPPGDDHSGYVALGDLDGDGTVPAVDEYGLPNINQDGLLPSIYVDDDMIA